MYFKFRDMPSLLRTPTGRKELHVGAFRTLWPLLSPIARLWRRTVARRTRVVTVIGSVGKTTTARVVGAVLCGCDYRVPKENYLSYTALAILGIRRRDPHAVMEIGISEAGQMAMYASLVRPDVAVVTAIQSDHAPSLGDIEVTRREKAEMVRALGPDGAVALNGDDPNVMWMAGRTRAKVTTFGFGEDCDVRATDVTLADQLGGTRFRLHAAGEVRDVHTRLIGRPMVRIALSGVATGLAEGLSLDTILPRLEQVEPYPRRLQPIRLTSGAMILQDAHKSSLGTIEASLDVLAELPARRRIVVVGEVDDLTEDDDKSRIYRQLGGRVAAVASRAVFACGEWEADCLAGAVDAGMSTDVILPAGNNPLAALELLDDLGSGDIVLLKSRSGQHFERIVMLMEGRDFFCRLPACRTRGFTCDECPALMRGLGNCSVFLSKSTPPPPDMNWKGTDRDQGNGGSGQRG